MPLGGCFLHSRNRRLRDLPNWLRALLGWAGLELSDAMLLKATRAAANVWNFLDL